MGRPEGGRQAKRCRQRGRPCWCGDVLHASTRHHPAAHGMSTPCISLRLPVSLYQPAHSSVDTGSLLQRAGWQGMARFSQASRPPAFACWLWQPVPCSARTTQHAHPQAANHSAHVIMPRTTRERSMREMRCSWMSCSSTPCSAALWSTDTWRGRRRGLGQTVSGATGADGERSGRCCLHNSEGQPVQGQAHAQCSRAPMLALAHASSEAHPGPAAAHLHHCPVYIVRLDDAIAEHEAPGCVLLVLLAGPEVNQLVVGRVMEAGGNSKREKPPGSMMNPRKTC